MEVTNMSDEIKETVAVEETAAPVESAEPSMAEVFHDPNAPIITVKKCLEAGVHFGHQTHRWNPKMGKYIYGARNGIYIVDLNKTVERTVLAYNALKAIVEAGGKVLFVGTKAQAQQIVIDEAVRSGSFYITNRWLGGTLTNWRTIASRIKRLRDLDAAQADGTWDKPSEEGSRPSPQRIRETRQEPRRIEGNAPPPAGHHPRRSDPRKDRRARSPQAQHPGLRPLRHQRRSRKHRFPDPDQQRRHERHRLIVGVLADAVVEARAGVTQIAYTKDEGEEATMADAIRVADIAAEQHRAAIRAARKAREERYAKMRAEREARFQARRAEQAKKAEAAKAEAAKESK